MEEGRGDAGREDTSRKLVNVKNDEEKEEVSRLRLEI